ncbi:ABC transporter substrate-binding protein [Natrarchaeobaculum sulfurireducens]|uniref:Branched-chain amino acid ABC transporter, aminoacid-binding protein n=1 Tax=Natrarchaeobaculum sulfurireducens TaxID=2044521 RepID=A0A346PTZ2_9EURY|nr:ABC transporter substrate-binding protein [Natrarchaeobaculum sulfurireducens]AXR82987.1 Branched-chain amino acid ABC transporter, aminoacid-binding protein [Natrarchaeobaculum sulfurireducens]
MTKATRGTNGSDASSSSGSSRGRARGRRRFLQATAVTGGLSLAGCVDTYNTVRDDVVGSTDEPDEDVVTIGLLAPDPESDFVGQSMVRSAEIAVADLEDDGGIDGKAVELVVGNTAANPLEARREYQRLVLEEGADVTVGIFDSPSLVNVMDDIAEQETIHLTAGAATADASRLVVDDYDRYKYHFRVGPPNDYDLGQVQMDFLEDIAPEVGWDSIALLAEDYDWTAGPWSVYQEQLGDTGVDVVLEEQYPPAVDDFSSLYDEVVEADADVVLATMAHTGTDAVLDWAHPNRPADTPEPYPFAFGGIHVPMQLPTYYDQTDGACRYGFGQISATAESEIGALTDEFVTAYESAHGDTPVYNGYHTYDGIRLFAQAVEQAGTLESDTLVETLEEASLDGTVGTVEFYDRDHEFAHDFVYHENEMLYFQWQERDGEGVQEIVWPDEHATAEFVSPEWI